MCIRTTANADLNVKTCIIRLLLCLLLVVSVLACSGGGGGSSSSGSSNSGTGGIAFGLAWKGSAANNTQPSFDICSTNVSTITANVYNSSNVVVASGSWPCAAHTGTMNNVPVGSNYHLIIEAKDSGGSITWNGQVINVNVNSGAVTNVGTVTMQSDLVSIAITPLNPSITLGSSQQFTAMGTYNDGTTLDLTLLASWTSSNTGIATINASGLATSVAVGSSNITATFASISNNTTLTVNPLPPTVYSVSGQVTLNGSGSSGITMTLSGIGSTTTDSSGNYSFSGVANGSHTITPSKTGYTFNPASISVTVNNANITGQNFIVPTYSISGQMTLNSAGLSGVAVTLTGIGTTTTDTNGNYSFTGIMNGSYTITPSKAGYSFSPTSISVTVNNANVTGQNFMASALTYYIFGQVTLNGSGLVGVTVTLSGTGSSSTTTDSNGNYSFSGVANGSYTITPSLTGYAFTPYDIPITINNANVTGQSFTARAVTYSVSGQVTLNSAGLSGVTVTLTGIGTTTTDTNGNYSFTGVTSGSYTITPSMVGYTFSPADVSLTVNSDVTGLNFIASLPTHSVSGQVTLNSSGLSGVTVTMTGTGSSSTTTDSNGNYTFTGAVNGSYTVTPSLTDYAFTPVSIPLTVNNANITGQNFTASIIAYNISGQVTLNGSGLAGVIMNGNGLSGNDWDGAAITDSSGNYTITGATNGSSHIYPYIAGYNFNPCTILLTVNNANITGQNFTASANLYQYVTQWGSYGTGNGQFYAPNGVAFDASGNIYVVDMGNNRIEKFSSSGTFITAWGSSGSGNGQFNTPNCVAVDTSGNVYVADTFNHRIQKFDSSGNFLLTWGSYAQFEGPTGIAVDASGNVYVTTYGNTSVQKFDSSGNFLLKWGSSGTGNGQFLEPNGVAVDASGNVYVVDTGNNRIEKFDSSGNFLLTWGSLGSGYGQFNYPSGIAVDASGNVYVTDVKNNRIEKFDSSGNFILTWGSPAYGGSGDGMFENPFYLAVDTSGNVYVADCINERIQVFSP